jgi:hypothetical protein
LIYDSNRDLYQVFTRWGRIGEGGMNQRSPHNSVRDAKKEFLDVFNKKTGGNNFENLDEFKKVQYKYNLTKINYNKPNLKDYLKPFELDKCPKSTLSEPVFNLFKSIANVTLYQRAIT